MTEEQKILAQFYNVETKDGLITAMLEHITRLQEKMPKPYQVAFVKSREG